MQALRELSQAYKGNGQYDASEILSVAGSLGETFQESVRVEVDARRKTCQKKLSDSIKLMLVNREGSFVKIGREKGKRVQECRELLLLPMSPMSTDMLRGSRKDAFPIEEGQARRIVTRELLQFYGDDGGHLGDCWRMSTMAARYSTSAVRKLGESGLELLEEEAEGLKSLLDDIKSVNRDSKRQVYGVRKAVESLMKDLRQKHGLFRPPGRLGELGGLMLAAEAWRMFQAGGGGGEQVAGILMLLDQTTHSFRTHAENLSPHFEERASGLARHAVLRLMEVTTELSTFSGAVKALGKSLERSRRFCFGTKVLRAVRTI